MKTLLKQFCEPDLYYKAFHLYDETALHELEQKVLFFGDNSVIRIKDDTFKKLLKKASLNYVELVLNSCFCIDNKEPTYIYLLFMQVFGRRKFESSQESIRFIELFSNNTMFNINLDSLLKNSQSVIFSSSKDFELIEWILEKNSTPENIHNIFELFLVTPGLSEKIFSKFLDKENVIENISIIKNNNVLLSILGNSKVYNIIKDKNLLDSYLMNSIKKEPLEILNFMWGHQNDNFKDFMLNHFELDNYITQKLTIHDPDKLQWIQKLNLYKNLPKTLNSHTINKKTVCKI